MLILPLIVVAAQAQSPVQTRAAELPAILDGRGDPAATFAPAFLAQVPAERIAALAAQLRAANGAVTGVEAVEAVSPYAARVRIGYANATATVEMVVEPAAPHRITGLLIKGTAAREASLEAVSGALATLPGATGFVLARLGNGAPVPVMARGDMRAFAIGSQFKLVILAELVRAIEAGERRWGDSVTLDGTPLPGGAYAQSPAGTTVTLKTLAERMISVSDNSATDILLKMLGRERVEAMLPVVGIAEPKGMRPFMGALELFKLKGANGAALGQRWRGLNERERRDLLAREVAAVPITAINPLLFADRKPVLIDSVEWFATPADMVRVMDWLRRHTEAGPAAEARAILAINPGVGASAAGWRYAGYKGGSEPGVIAMTFLLQGKAGGWYAMSASWNDPAAAVDDARFAALMARAVELAAEPAPPR